MQKITFLRTSYKIAIFDTSKRAGNKRPREYEAPQREYECGRVFSRTFKSVETSFFASVGVLYGQHALSVTEKGGVAREWCRLWKIFRVQCRMVEAKILFPVI